jgi:hypothetical protein
MPPICHPIYRKRRIPHALGSGKTQARAPETASGIGYSVIAPHLRSSTRLHLRPFRTARWTPSSSQIIAKRFLRGVRRTVCNVPRRTAQLDPQPRSPFASPVRAGGHGDVGMLRRILESLRLRIYGALVSMLSGGHLPSPNVPMSPHPPIGSARESSGAPRDRKRASSSSLMPYFSYRGSSVFSLTATTKAPCLLYVLRWS